VQPQEKSVSFKAILTFNNLSFLPVIWYTGIEVEKVCFDQTIPKDYSRESDDGTFIHND
jgi:hypothetical protein